MGAGGLLLLTLAIALLTRDNSQGIAPSPESIPNLPASPSAEGAVKAGRDFSFIPGGRKLPVVDADAPIARQSVLTLASHDDSLPPANDLQVRSRVATLASDLDLRPPTSGEGADAARDLVFDLFDDVQLVGRVERMEYHHAERVVYSGPLTNVPGGDFIVAYNSRQIAATFTTPGMGFFQLRPSGTDAVAVYQLDLSRLPPCEASTPPASPSSGAAVTASTSVAEIRARSAIHRQFAASSPSVEGGVYGGQGQQGGDGSHLTFTQLDVLV
ncbi:hypothetical protein RZS08_25855, partial [Arthrospira platensis SPKY1]|nr:hypothetical protein [Arthrospira platensis SPKY1]